MLCIINLLNHSHDSSPVIIMLHLCFPHYNAAPSVLPICDTILFLGPHLPVAITPSHHHTSHLPVAISRSVEACSSSPSSSGGTIMRSKAARGRRFKAPGCPSTYTHKRLKGERFDYLFTRSRDPYTPVTQPIAPSCHTLKQHQRGSGPAPDDIPPLWVPIGPMFWYIDC